MSMSLRITAVCDGCGAIIGEAGARATQEGYVTARLLLDHNWRKGTLEDARAWKHTRHYCQPCADGTQAKVLEAAKGEEA